MTNNKKKQLSIDVELIEAEYNDEDEYNEEVTDEINKNHAQI